MQKILVAQADETMVLAKAVETPEGRVLCGKGTTLTAALIDRLKRMDVLTITVDGHPVKEEGELTLPEELQKIELRFSRVTKTPPLMYIKKRLMEKLIASRGK